MKHSVLLALVVWLSCIGILQGSLTSLETPMPLLLHVDATYSFAYIPSIQGTINNPTNYHTAENQLCLSSWMSTLSNWELGLLFEFNQTKRLTFNLESGGLYVKKGFLDDLQGDYLGCDASIVAQFVPTNRLTDPVTPYSALANFSVLIEAYKNYLFYYDEIDLLPFVGLEIGMANKGYPWLNPLIGGRFEYKGFALDGKFSGTFGLGPQSYVNVDDFKGYSQIGYQAIDFEISASYPVMSEGSLEVGYFDRLYARCYPKGRQGFFVALDLPIPLF